MGCVCSRCHRREGRRGRLDSGKESKSKMYKTLLTGLLFERMEKL